MKKRLALVMILMLLGACALAEPMGYADYTDDILEDGSPIYYFPELSLQLPADWQGKVMAMPGESSVSFYQKASYEKYQEEGLNGGGFLFMLGVCADDGYTFIPNYRFLGHSNDSSMNYYLMLPSDYPAHMGDDAIRAEYDAMSAEVDEVAARIEFYPYVSVDTAAPASIEVDTDMGEAEPPAAQAGAAEGASLEKARYHFEHSTMPRFFYEDPANMIDVLSQRGMYQMWSVFANENGVDYPYQPEDFSERLYELEGGARVLQVVMPKPEETPLCFRVYMIYNAETGSAGYYTVEYDNLLGDAAMLCGWTAAHEHMNYSGAPILDASDSGYAAALEREALQVAELSGNPGALMVYDDGIEGLAEGDAGADDVDIASGADDVDVSDGAEDAFDTTGLAEIPCPELGFSVMADPAYSWDYREGTGISIYTEEAGSIPYVIVFQSGNKVVDIYEYIQEQYTPGIQRQYGDDLVGYVEYESYDIGGKQLPAGLYTYRLQGYLVDLLRIFDSTGDHTVAYTAKYIQGQGDATLAALDAAVRTFKAE